MWQKATTRGEVFRPTASKRRQAPSTSCVEALKFAAFLVVATAMVLVPSTGAYAHSVGLSRGDYVATGSEVVADLTFARLDVATPIARGVVVRDARGDCPSTLEAQEPADDDAVHVRIRFRCATTVSSFEVALPLLDSLPPGHRHIARLAIGAVSREDVLSRGHDSISVTAREPTDSPPTPVGPPAFVRMGVEHILTGYDHLVFLFGLLLVGGRVRALVGVVTAFTIAHSITLALAVLDVWTPPSRVVEAGIALSIAYVGVENFFVTNAEGRWRITFPFGLVHGFGFASALREVSLARAQIPVALVSFNVGVEIGQLGVMALLLPLIVVAKRRGWLDRRLTLVLSAGVALAGVVWFVHRAVF